jgi:hypothetical protein
LLLPELVLADELLPDDAGGELYCGAATDDSPWPDVVGAEVLDDVTGALLRSAARTARAFDLAA